MKRPSREYVLVDAQLFDALIARSIELEQIAQRFERVKRQATTDALTGLANRRGFELAFQRARAHALRFHRPLTVILLDIDHFKRVNDRYGHAAGDRVLSRVAGVISREARAADLIGRWGGEEFVLALTETDLDGARRFAERLRRRISAELVVDGRGECLPATTASMGLAGLAPRDDLASIVERADKALYAAKSDGRNRVRA